MSVSWEIKRSFLLSLFNQDYTFRVSWLLGPAQLPQSWRTPEPSGLGCPAGGWAKSGVEAPRPAHPFFKPQGPSPRNSESTRRHCRDGAAQVAILVRRLATRSLSTADKYSKREKQEKQVICDLTIVV